MATAPPFASRRTLSRHGAMNGNRGTSGMVPRILTVSRLWPRRLQLPRLRWLVLLALVAVVALGVGAAVLVRQEAQTVTYYACVKDKEVLYFGRRNPTSCPEGSVMAQGDVEVDGPVENAGRRITAQLRSHLTIPDVMIALSAASLLWILAGWNIDGTWLLLAWVAVPFSAVAAAACVAGPGHWFPKEPYEGPSVIPLGRSDAITVLDLVGFGIAALTLLSAILLVRYRMQQPRAAPMPP